MNKSLFSSPTALLVAVAVSVLVLPRLASAESGRPRVELKCVSIGTGPLLECLVKTQHRDGSPLEGAHVTLGALMPSMPMAHTIKPARATPTGNAGEYKGTLELEMSGVWTVEVSFSTPVKDKQTRNLMVNECRGTARCDATPAPVGVDAHKDHTQHGSHKH